MPAEFGMFMYGRLPAMQVSCCQDYIRRIRSPNAPAELLAFVQEFEINSLLVEVPFCSPFSACSAHCALTEGVGGCSLYLKFHARIPYCHLTILLCLLECTTSMNFISFLFA